MTRIAAIVALVLVCGPLSLAGQEGRVDTVLVLKTGQEVRGEFVGFRNGLFTLRLPDGKITIHSVGDVDRMQPAAGAPASAPTPPAAVRTQPPPMAAPVVTPPPAAAPAVVAPPAAAPAAAPAMAVPAPTTGTAAAATACGPAGVKMPTLTDKTQHPTPNAPADKALVYVVRPSSAGGRIQSRLAVNGAWVGANYGNNYFIVTLDPGEHQFCSEASERNVMSMKVEAGKTYYLHQTVTTGMMKARSSLQAVDESAGRASLADAFPSVKREPRQDK